MNAKSYYKVLVLSALLVGAAIPGFSATNGSLVLSGVVAPVTSILVQPDPNASNLPIGTTVSGLAIAAVNELSNNKAGYKVSLASANGGTLKESDTSEVGLQDSLAYSLTYDGNPVTFVNGSAVISNSDKRTSAVGATKTLAISFASEFLNADTYTDVLTFTIAAN